jgi:hypothetical protein
LLEKLSGFGLQHPLKWILSQVRMAAFFEGSKSKELENLIKEYEALLVQGSEAELREKVDRIRMGSQVLPFNWEAEFPEVFDRQNSGFDVIIGNPLLRVKTSLSMATWRDPDKQMVQLSGTINVWSLSIRSNA